MKLLFCLNHYFPFGGLERDCLRIARACVSAGDTVDIVTQDWEGPQPEDITVHCLPVKALTNHGRSQKFSRRVEKFIKAHHFDGVIGFNKMPGLDIYYAGDVCYRENWISKNIFKHINPRHRAYLALEEIVFSPARKTHILLLNPQQRNTFVKHYKTPDDRFHILPPGIELSRRVANTASTARIALRHAKGIEDDQNIILFIASFFDIKGLDRALRAVGSLPEAVKQKTQLWVIGKDSPKPYLNAIQKDGLAGRVKFVGASENVPEYLSVADLLLHPAYQELAGMVLLEALAAGVPVMTTQVCGYAHYISDADAGHVLSEPFAQAELNQSLAHALTSGVLTSWREKARYFSQTADIYRMPDVAVKLIHQLIS